MAIKKWLLAVKIVPNAKKLKTKDLCNFTGRCRIKLQREGTRGTNAKEYDGQSMDGVRAAGLIVT
jgi:hypothetical protein